MEAPESDRPVMAFALEILPDKTSVPPAVWEIVVVLAVALPRMIGAEMVFVPLVFSEEMAELEFNRSEPDVAERM